MNKKYYLEHREEILKKTLDKHKENWKYKNYRELTNARKRVCTVRDQIDAYVRKIANKKKEIIRLARKIEILELAWGKERAERKKLWKKNENSNQEQLALSK